MNKLNKAIIMALHPECKTWEEAAKKELINGCLMSNNHQLDDNPFKIKTFVRKKMYNSKLHYVCTEKNGSDSLFPAEALTPLGLPISLSRVMQALGCCYFEAEAYEGGEWNFKLEKGEFNWKLTENGKDLYLEDQSEEIKKALSKLFNV